MSGRKIIDKEFKINAVNYKMNTKILQLMKLQKILVYQTVQLEDGVRNLMKNQITQIVLIIRFYFVDLAIIQVMKLRNWQD